MSTWAPLLVCAALVTGCGSSLSGDGIKSEFTPQEQIGGASLAPTAVAGDSKPASASPVALGDAAKSLTAAATPGDVAYKIGPQDVIDVAVFKVPDLSRTAQVSDAGTINLPLVGEVQAGGKTSRELEKDLAKRLGAKYLQSPQVTVNIREYNSRRVTVDGSVGRPGVYPIKERTSLLQIIAIAGGPTDVSDTGDIVIFRQTNGQRTAARVDLDDIRSGKAQDPPLQQGDVVIVNASEMKTAFQSVLKALPITSLFVPLL